MRFDASLFWHALVPIPWKQQVQETREFCRAVEGLGFVTAWSCEHHLAHDRSSGCPPNALITSLDIANHTTTLRVGQAPYQIMDRHPLQVAEDIALVDNMSDGRLDVGVGRGLDERWGAQFSPFADRRNQEQNRAYFEECMEIIIKGLTQEAFSHKGRFFTIPNPGWKEWNPRIKVQAPWYNEEGEYVAVGVMPKPLQQPHPPIWVTVASDGSYTYAGAMGFGAIGTARSPEGIAESYGVFRQAWKKAHGVAFSGDNLGVQFPTYCAPTMEEALRDARELLGRRGIGDGLTGLQTAPDATQREVIRKQRQGLAGPGVDLSNDDLNMDIFDFRVKFGPNMIGTPDSISEKIEQYQTVAGLPMYQMFPQTVYDFKLAMRSLELFADKVMPRFANKPAKKSEGVVTA